MIKKNLDKHAKAKVRWKSKLQTGRKKVLPPQKTDRFALTAYRQKDKTSSIFSLILMYEPLTSACGMEVSEHEAFVYFFAPSRIIPNINVGEDLILTEADLEIGELTITELYPVL